MTNHVGRHSVRVTNRVGMVWAMCRGDKSCRYDVSRVSG